MVSFSGKISQGDASARLSAGSSRIELGGEMKRDRKPKGVSASATAVFMAALAESKSVGRRRQLPLNLPSS
jgi:hypothetical protein